MLLPRSCFVWNISAFFITSFAEHWNGRWLVNNFSALRLQTLRYLNSEVLWAFHESICGNVLIPKCTSIPLMCVQTLKVKFTQSWYLLHYWTPMLALLVLVVRGLCCMLKWWLVDHEDILDLSCQVTLHSSWNGSWQYFMLSLQFFGGNNIPFYLFNRCSFFIFQLIQHYYWFYVHLSC